MTTNAMRPGGLIDQSNCAHGETESRIKRFSDGSWHVADQCLRCGARVGNWKKQNESMALHEWDESLAARGAYDLQEERAKRSAEHSSARRAEYALYLQTHEWRIKRAKVLDRAKGVCEGCGDRPAVHVHHLSYAHTGSEFLWELVAVCHECHRRCHPEKDPNRFETPWLNRRGPP